MSLFVDDRDFAQGAGPDLTEPAWAGTSEADSIADTVIAFNYTGDYRVDVLLDGLESRWNAGKALGTPVTVTYSFMGAAPAYGGNTDSDSYGFSAFNSAQKAAVRQIFAKLQSELNIRFTEVSDSTTSYGQIRLGNNVQEYSTGYAWYPSNWGDVAGDVWIDSSTPGNATPTVGTWGYATLVHEIGHALGLKHPGNYNAGTVAQDVPGNYLGSAEDTTDYTVMSYYDPAGGQPRDWYGQYDLLALKKLYGANTSFNAGNTVHRLSDASGGSLGIIDDASGNDTLDLSGVTLAARIDLHAGAFSSVGRNGSAAAVNNLSIELATVIENLVGTAYGDIVTGNDANNRFTLGQGSNTANGAGGLDTAVYAGTRGAYQAKASGGTVTVTGANVYDALISVERLEFGNGKLAFDLAGNAGSTAKVLGAVFGTAALTRADYVKEGLALLDGGRSYADAVKTALDFSVGASASNKTVVDTLYTNVAGHAPSAAQESYYIGLLQSGAATRTALATMAADSLENAIHIDLVGLAANGLAYA